MPAQRQAAEGREVESHPKDVTGNEPALLDNFLNQSGKYRYSFQRPGETADKPSQKDNHLPEVTIVESGHQFNFQTKSTEAKMQEQSTTDNSQPPQLAAKDSSRFPHNFAPENMVHNSINESEFPKDRPRASPRADSKIEQKLVVPAAVEVESKKYELHLKHSAHGSRDADAVVLVPKGFDATKPINVVIYNHGWNDTATSSFRNANLEEQMKAAPPDTVLVVPEWQVNPGGSHAKGNQQGAYAEKDFATKMLQDVFDKTPQLHGKTLADVSHIGLISHSAGFLPTVTQLDSNPELAKKVNSITLLDSLYNTHGFDGWIKDNVADLASGKKTFQNIFSDETHGQSMMQAQFLARELAEYKRGRPNDYARQIIDTSDSAPSASQLSRQTVLFKSTSSGHSEIPRKFIRVVQEAARS